MPGPWPRWAPAWRPRRPVATAALFDLGVFLTVLGAVMLALASLSRIAVRAGEVVNLAPFDVDPQAGGGR